MTTVRSTFIISWFRHQVAFFLFTLLFTPGARLPVLGPFLVGGALTLDAALLSSSSSGNAARMN